MKKLYFSLATFLFLAVANAQIVNIPDANFKARLLNAYTGNTTASTSVSSDGSVFSYNKIDTNNDGEIQVSEAIAIRYLNITTFPASITNLDGISSFSNLRTLRCNGNLLTNLDVNGLINLENLSCNSNQLTSLNVNGLINLRSIDCSVNQLTSINLTGFNNLTKINCAANQLTSLNITNLTNLTELICSGNYLTNLNVNGLTNIHTFMCEGNQLTSLNVSGLLSLYDFRCYDNMLTNLQVNNPILTHLYCYNNQLTSLNLDNTKLVNLNCSNNQLTSLFAKNGNAAWSSVYLNNNPNLSYICVDEEDITFFTQAGYGGNINSYCSFTPGGNFYIIQGNQKYDNNSNGCNTSDPIFPNLKFNITNGTISGNLISNASGNYSIPVQTGTHTITPQIENPTYFTITPSSVIVTFPTVISPAIRNFCIAPNGVHRDLEVVIIPVNVARPGFEATYKIKYKNKGTVSENATIIYNYNDAILNFVSSNVTPTSQATGTRSWNIGTIAPFQSGEILVTLNVNSPTETPPVNAGTILSYAATVNGINTDETPVDNTFALNQTVVNSFDPNDKKCLEGSTISSSMIGEYVHYKIRFENTGTYPAQNIVVKDIINTTKFDVSTLQITDSSHNCVTKISNTNKVEFIFENINLPFDDANNDGYVVFKIKTKSTLAVNSTISNSANIYFDYNFPIVTNTATSSFSVLQNDTFEFDNYFTIYPNPVKEALNITSKQETEISSLSIYNLLGQQVQTILKPSNTIDISNLKSGNYIVKINTEKGVSYSKFIKE